MSQGVVVAFDDHVGLGWVETSAGDRLQFHCTQIEGDSRTIAVGTEVDFVVRGRPKGDEAYQLKWRR